MTQNIIFDAIDSVKLKKAGISDFFDMLLLAPSHYEDRRVALCADLKTAKAYAVTVLGVKESPKFISFRLFCDSLEIEIPSNSIIYCDPPYASTTKYKDDFDHDKFWIWCEQKVKEGHSVYVSEYNAPNNWNCIWEKEITSSLTQDTGSKKATEKLFTLE